MTFWKKQNNRDRKQISDFQGLEVKKEADPKGAQGYLLKWWNVLYLHDSSGYKPYALVKIHEALNYTLKKKDEFYYLEIMPQ